MGEQRLLARLAGVHSTGSGHYSPYLTPSAALVRQLFALNIRTCVGDYNPLTRTLTLRNSNGRRGPKGYVLQDCLQRTRIQFSIVRLTGSTMPRTIYGLYEGVVEGNSVVFNLALPPTQRTRFCNAQVSLPALELHIAAVERRLDEIHEEVRMLTALSTASIGEG